MLVTCLPEAPLFWPVDAVWSFGLAVWPAMLCSHQLLYVTEKEPECCQDCCLPPATHSHGSAPLSSSLGALLFICLDGQQSWWGCAVGAVVLLLCSWMQDVGTGGAGDTGLCGCFPPMETLWGSSAPFLLFETRPRTTSAADGVADAHEVLP